MKRTARTPATPRKRPYRSPKLVVHGDLKTLTAAKGGTSTDGGSKPSTRNSGPQS